VHSELDFFTPDQHAHGSHDYCEIVDSAKPENTNIDRCKTVFPDAPVVLLYIPVIHYCESQTLNFNTSNKPNINYNLTLLYGSLLI